MRLYSTNRSAAEVSFKEAVFKGLPDDNGLFMPVSIPQLPSAFFETIDKLSFQEIAFQVTKTLIGDEIPDADLKKIIDDVLSFDAPLVKVEDNISVLELFHGPSLAFKDFGARFMAKIMSYFLQKEKKEIHILVATSGDTGSAVAQGFLGMPGIKVTILYPSGKVSDIQEKQLTTLGQNITALEVNGTFDDCQRLVKEAFLDKELNNKINLSSANSINISRLIPQSFYYFYAYSKLKSLGLPVVFSTPSGNFGNLCGGLIAKRMGLPIHKFVASTNANDVVPEFLETGIFNPRPSVATISNAMDVGNPSNYARLVELYGKDLEAIKKDIFGTRYNDEETAQAIEKVYKAGGYIMDPHGAVAYLGLKEYAKTTGEKFSGVFLATAHPSKFIEVVEEIINKKIELPERLQTVVNKKKEAFPLTSDFSDLKSYLLKSM
ncbi:threonine synthase [Sporocytophaga myxococcoides]|uniref:Threonine synthase n=1 Tax=Sporocytophaga myxococcoides TaxID=153721 RepID=A0A098LCQ5_9BACT|nr:threonine synthase [Sporocytophaga myxococcoides]GAL83953.1 threonine synthase [Sporocytophaga myxococcoides]